MLSSCASASKDLPAPLAVDLSALSICERMLEPVAMPKVKVGDDAPGAFVKDEAALIVARGRTQAGRDCVRDVRVKYGGEGNKP